ncbi:MAG TPA: M50 family metallopeptidase [Kofleriaceae bacterium]|nr:M50 family metallopeptidase [Kofleriaceae bacterium]
MTRAWAARGGLRAVVGALALTAATARAAPSDRTLVLTGLALAPPTYLVGVTLHEGSHAVAATLVGASVDELHLFPPGRDPHTHTFRFGWTYVRGLRSQGDKIVFYLAPKFTDAALLGGFAALAFTGAWPTNRYGQLALTVFATGLWVDFAKDVVLFAPTNDVVKVLELTGLTGWRQVPARLAYAGLVVGLGVIVARGYERTFDRSTDGTASARIVPLLGMAF